MIKYFFIWCGAYSGFRGLSNMYDCSDMGYSCLRDVGGGGGGGGWRVVAQRRVQLVGLGACSPDKIK